MASPLTANFMAAFRKEQRDMATLVKVELTSPSVLTLYLGTREIVTPGPVVWQMALADVEPIHAPGSLRESSWSPCSTGFTVLDVPLAHQTAGKRAMDVFHTHRWIGATVTVYFWETGLTSAADLAQMFKGWIQDYEPDGFKMVVRCLQRWNWNHEVDLISVTRKRYPRAPEESVGQLVPKVRGSVRSIGMRSPWTAEYSFNEQHVWEHITGGRRAMKGVLVDSGGGPSDLPSRVLFASHACKTFDPMPTQDKGSVPYIAIDDKLCLFDAASASIFNSDADGAGIKIGSVVSGGTDSYQLAFYPMMPVNLELASVKNTENGRAVLDVANETSYAVMDYTNNLWDTWVRLATVAPAGDIVTVYYCFGYQTGGAAAGSPLALDIYSGGSSIASANFAASSTPTVGVLTFASPANLWNFGDVVMKLFWNGANANATARIYFMGAIIKFRPKGEVVGNTMQTITVPYKIQATDPLTGETAVLQVPRKINVMRAVSRLGFHRWFATLEGYADDGGGTYTGTASALIERAPDIARHLLVLDGGESAGNITTAASTFGSFVDARAALKTWRQSDMLHALILSDVERVSQALERLAVDAGAWCYLSEFDDKWKWIVWRSGAAVDYSPKLTVRDLAPGLRLRPTPGSRRETGISVRYGFDEFRGRSVHETGIGPGRSTAGHKYRNLRDQQFTVLSSGPEQNNKIDIHGSYGDATATIANGSYTGSTMLSAVKTALVAARNKVWAPCRGPTTVTGVNDRFVIQENEGAQDTFVVVIPQSDYATMELYATAIQTACNGVSDSFTVTYSRTTRKLTIARAVNTFRLNAGLGTPADLTALVAMGYVVATTAYVASRVADFEREEEIVTIGNTEEAFDLEWETGTNGTNGNNTNAANLLGYDAARDDLGYSVAPALTMLTAICPTGNREQAIAAITAGTGEKLPIVIEGRTIYDHDTAREVRNRAADLLCVNRPEISASLLWAVDLERGRVIEFDSSLDALWPYAVEGSDGSWAGKKFQVVDKVQHVAGSYITEIAAVEIS
jgi:hypothetical protein